MKQMNLVNAKFADAFGEIGMINEVSELGILKLLG